VEGERGKSEYFKRRSQAGEEQQSAFQGAMMPWRRYCTLKLAAKGTLAKGVQPYQSHRAARGSARA
jgi:hypothetical protein